MRNALHLANERRIMSACIFYDLQNFFCKCENVFCILYRHVPVLLCQICFHLALIFPVTKPTPKLSSVHHLQRQALLCAQILLSLSSLSCVLYRYDVKICINKLTTMSVYVAFNAELWTERHNLMSVCIPLEQLHTYSQHRYRHLFSYHHLAQQTGRGKNSTGRPTYDDIYAS